MAENTFDILKQVVAGMKGPQDWSFRIEDDDGALRFVVRIMGTNNYDPDQPYVIDHFHPVPVCTFNEKSWRRWVFDKCCATMNHELGETVRFGPDQVRPFAPMHGPGENPYTVHEVRPEIDALTTQDGSIRPGPV